MCLASGIYDAAMMFMSRMDREVRRQAAFSMRYNACVLFPFVCIIASLTFHVHNVSLCLRLSCFSSVSEILLNMFLKWLLSQDGEQLVATVSQACYCWFRDNPSVYDQVSVRSHCSPLNCIYTRLIDIILVVILS